MRAGYYARSAIYALGFVKLYFLFSCQCFCRAGFYAAIAGSCCLAAAAAARAFAVFPAAFLVINLDGHELIRLIVNLYVL